ncbi:titin-like, partial [Spodoptera frugiperda]|uniref:Titin-like n=1 Tax=Spodoptera frugiperda TaxID=7108 RepID=A0A9R0E325_SPOFR
DIFSLQVISSVIFAVVCGFLFKPANLSAIDYGPVKIIVRESPDALTDIVHQGENFYFKHYVNSPSSHFEAIMSLIQQDASRLEEETEELQKILKPFIRHETKSKDRVSKVQPLPKPSPLPVPVILEDKEPELIISNQQQISVESISPQIIDMPAVIEEISLEGPDENKENSVIIPEEDFSDVKMEGLEENIVVPEVTVLTLGTIDNPVIMEEVKLEDQKIEKENILVVPEAVTQISVVDPVFVEEVKPDAPKVSEKVQNTLYLSSVIIPENPVLSHLSTNGYAVSVEQVNAKEPKVHDDSGAAILETPVIPEPFNNSPTVVDEIEIEEPEFNKDNIIVVSEAPVYSPLLVQNNSAVIEEIKYEEPKIIEESQNLMHLSPVIIPEPSTLSPLVSINNDYLADGEDLKVNEIEVSKEPDNTLYLSSLIIPEAPVLPPLPVSNYNMAAEQEYGKELKLHALSVETVSETPLFPGPVHNNPAVAEEVKVEEPHVYKESIIEVPEAPVLPLLSIDNNPETLKQIEIEEPKINKENIIVVSEPVLVENSPTVIEEVKIEEPKISEKSENLLHVNSVVVPKIPILPPPSSINSYTTDGEKGKDEEPKVSEEPEDTMYLRTVIVPEAPVLPPLPVNNYNIAAEQEYGKEPKLHAPRVETVSETPLFPGPVHNNPAVAKEVKVVEPHVYKESIIEVPEAPVLPLLSIDNNPETLEQIEIEEPENIKEDMIVVSEPVLVENSPAIIEEVKIEEPKISEISENVIHLHSVVIPEIPILPPFSINSYTTDGENRKVEEPKVSEEPEDTMYLRSEPSELLPLPVNNYDIAIEQVNVEEPTLHEHRVEIVSETPLFLTPVHNNPTVAEEVKIEEPRVYQESIIEVPEAPVLPLLSIDNNPVTLEHIEIEEPMINKENIIVVSEPLLVDNSPAVIEEVKIEEPKISENSENVLQLSSVVVPEIQISSSPFSINNYPTDDENIKFEELKVFAEPESTMYLRSEPSELLPLPVNNYDIVIEQVNVNEPTLHEHRVDVVSEAPLFHEAVHYNPAVVEEVKVIEPHVYEESIIEVPEAPVLPLLSIDNNPATLEHIEIEEPKINKENILVVSEPVLVENSPSVIEEVKIEEPKISEESENVLHLSSVVVPEIPISPPFSINHYSADGEEGKVEEAEVSKEPENEIYLSSVKIPEAPMLPPLSNERKEEVYKESIAVIPEAPTLPPVLVNNNSAVFEEVKVEEPKVSEGTKNTLHLSSLVVPEYPVLHENSLKDISTVEKQIEEQESISLRQSVTKQNPEDVYVVEAKSTEKPNHFEPKRLENEGILEAPVLPAPKRTDVSAVKKNDKPKDKMYNHAESPDLPPLSLRDLLLHKENERLEDFLPHVPEYHFVSKIEAVPKYVSEEHEIPEQKKKLNEELPHLLRVSHYPKLKTLPDAPILPPLSLSDFPYPKK